MKKIKVVGLVIGLIGIFGVGNVMAAGTATITVNATVLETCSFDTTAYTMPFGDLDPGSSTDVSKTVSLAFTCGNGTTYTLDNIAGTQTMNSGGNSLDYEIATYTLGGKGTGATQTVDITGTVAAADFQLAAAGTYTDTLTININP